MRRLFGTSVGGDRVADLRCDPGREFHLHHGLLPGPATAGRGLYTFFKQQVEAENVDRDQRPGRYGPGNLSRGSGVSARRRNQRQDGEGVLDESARIRRSRARDVAQRARRRRSTHAGPKLAVPLLTLLFSFGPTLLLIGGFVWLFRRSGKCAAAGSSAWARARPGGTTRRPPARTR